MKTAKKIFLSLLLVCTIIFNMIPKLNNVYAVDKSGDMSNSFQIYQDEIEIDYVSDKITLNNPIKLRINSKITGGVQAGDTAKIEIKNSDNIINLNTTTTNILRFSSNDVLGTVSLKKVSTGIVADIEFIKNITDSSFDTYIDIDCILDEKDGVNFLEINIGGNGIDYQLNKEKMYNLKISKIVEIKGKYMPHEQNPFLFTIKIMDISKAEYKEDFKFKKNGILQIENLKYNETDGGIVFRLKDKENIEILNVPEGFSYEIKEHSPGGEYETVPESRIIKGKIDKDKEEKFINKYTAPINPGEGHSINNSESPSTGRLKIKKVLVSDNPNDKDKLFRFEIKGIFKDGDAEISGYDYIGEGIDNGTIYRVYPYIFLKDGQSITIKGIKKDMTYEVIEYDYTDEGFTLTSKENDTGNIVAGDTIETKFINSKTLSEKPPSGGTTGSDTPEETKPSGGTTGSDTPEETKPPSGGTTGSDTPEETKPPSGDTTGSDIPEETKPDDDYEIPKYEIEKITTPIEKIPDEKIPKDNPVFIPKKTKKLPKTGEHNKEILFYISGCIVLLGVMIFKQNKK